MTEGPADEGPRATRERDRDPRPEGIKR